MLIGVHDPSRWHNELLFKHFLVVVEPVVEIKFLLVDPVVLRVIALERLCMLTCGLENEV